MERITVEQLAKYLDHVIEIDFDFDAHCDFARKYQVACCAVAENNVADIKARLQGSGVLVSGAVAFPGGDSMPEAKLIDVRRCIELGADEVDYVINLTEVKQHRWAMVEKEMGDIADLCRKHNVSDKAIIECCILTQEEKRRVCEIARETRPAFVKTSTGDRSGGGRKTDHPRTERREHTHRRTDQRTGRQYRRGTEKLGRDQGVCRGDQQYRRTDESAVAERVHRGGESGRGRQRLCRGGRGDPQAGRPVQGVRR